jgi:hypothetical protein
MVVTPSLSQIPVTVKGLGDVPLAKLAQLFQERATKRQRRSSERGTTGVQTLERFVQTANALMISRQHARSGPATAMAVVALALGASVAVGCAHREYFPGTEIVRSEENRKIIETVEEYRRRLMQRNVVGLLALASPRYFEDSGTPRSDDDYGYDGLKRVLEKQLPRVKSLRYDIEYRNIHVTGTEVEVEVFVDGSFEIAAPEAGDRYRRVNDYHRFLLAKEGDEWKFLGGM